MRWDDVHADFVFVTEELIRFLELANSGNLQSIGRHDALHMLQRPSDRRLFIIGREAARRLSKIARQAFESDEVLRRRVSLESVRKELERRYADALFSGQDFDQSVSRRIIEESLHAVKRLRLRTTTHILPCILSYDTEIDEFTVGLVRFLTVERFFKEYETSLDEHTNQTRLIYLRQERNRIIAARPRLCGKEPAWPRLEIERAARRLEDEAREYLSTYKWVATVRIVDCDDPTSEYLARLSVEAALNLLRLFIGAFHADDFRLGGGFRPEEKTAKLTIRHDGSLRISVSRSAGHAVIDGNWVQIVLRGDDSGWLHAAGSLIHSFQSERKVPLIYRRLLDALWWYGEGVSEPLPHAKIIRYCSALEAFLGTAKDNIAHSISLRAAYLCADDVFAEAMERYKETKEVYALRSALVHGGLSPFDRRVAENVQRAERIARRTLLAGLEWTMWLARTDFQMSSKRLHQHFEVDLPWFAYGLAREAGEHPV